MQTWWKVMAAYRRVYDSCHLQADCQQPGSATVFTARCYASAVLAMALCPSVCLSVCLSVCPSQVGVLLKRLNVGSHRQHLTIAQGLYFSDTKDLREIRPGSPPTRAPNAGGVGQNRRLFTNNRLSKTVRDRHLVSIKVE